MFAPNIVPGQGFLPFKIYKKQGGVTESGRATNGTYKPNGSEILGMLTSASQKEQEQWKQKGHPITHKIIEYSAMKKADAENYLVQEHQNRQFYVQGTKNPANLNITMIYYVEERFDVKMEVE